MTASRPAHAPSLDEDEFVEFKVRIDLKTVAWLMDLAEVNHAPPAVVAASLLRDVRRDDEMAHEESQFNASVNAPSTPAVN